MDAHRRRAARPREVGDEALALLPANGDDIDRALESWLVADALATLTPAHREVLVQTYFSGRTVSEAAGQLGHPRRDREITHALRPAGAPAGPARAGGDVMSSCPHLFDVAPYALGTLDEPDRAELEAHLPTCPECRVLLAEVAGLPKLLARVPVADVVGAAPPAPSEAMFERLVASAVTERRTRRTRLALVGAAAAAAVVLAGAGGTALVQARSGPGVQVVAAAAGDVHARVELRATDGGTGLKLQLSGVPALEHCSLVAVGRDGRREVAASWEATYEGTATFDGTTSIPASELASLRIETDTATLVTMPVPATG